MTKTERYFFLAFWRKLHGRHYSCPKCRRFQVYENPGNCVDWVCTACGYRAFNANFRGWKTILKKAEIQFRRQMAHHERDSF